MAGVVDQEVDGREVGAERGDGALDRSRPDRSMRTGRASAPPATGSNASGSQTPREHELQRAVGEG